jgi:parvulin-like peptidyl-prolyl isomerase
MNRFLLLLVLTVATATAPAQVLPDSGLLLDSYAAVVNGKVITVGQILAAMQSNSENLSTRYAGESLRQKLLEEYDTVRDAFIESELILLDFEMQGGSVPDRAVEDHINGVIHDRFGNDRTAFLKALAAERLTFSEWRKQMKEQLVVQIMRQKEVSSKILIAPFDLQIAYDQRRATFAIPERIRIRTLSLPATGGAPSPAELRDRLRSGETTFEKEATAATLLDDGEFIDVASIDQPFRAAIAPLSPGGFSEPVEAGGTTYFIQLVDRQPARIRTFDEAAPEIEKELRAAEYSRLNRIWINSLRTKYYIQLFAHNLFD